MVEHLIEDQGVGGSTPSLGTRIDRHMYGASPGLGPWEAGFDTLVPDQFNAGMVELADTLVLGTSASAWGFKSLYPYQVCGVIL